MLPLLTETEVKFLEYMKACYERLEACQQKIAALPEGTVCTRHVNGKTYYRYSYYKDGIRKQQNCSSKEAKKRMQKIELRIQLNDEVKRIKRILKKNLEIYRSIMLRADQMLQDFYSKKYHLTPAKEGAGMSYMPENLKMTSSEGIRVRSKSELLIVERLQSHHLVFSYERPLKLDGHKNFLPDFTLYEPLTGKMIYWEHFGLMNHSDYKLSAENKLLQYAENNIIEGKNLIVTYDNTDGSIDMQQIETIIQKYFFLASYRLNFDFVPKS